MTIEKFFFKYNKPEYEEKFKVITYPGVKQNKYFISNHGRVLVIKTKKIMKTYFDDDYHEKITLVTDIKHPTKKGNKSKHYFIHRLMAWEFLGPAPDDLHNVVNHKNGIPCCNFIDNLEWSSVLDNTNHAKKNKLLDNAGINSYSNKYDERFIRKICEMLEKGMKNKEVLEYIIGVDKSLQEQSSSIYQLISKLKKKVCYHDIVSEYNFKSSININTKDKTTNKIRLMILDDDTNYDILKEFGYKEPSDDIKFYNKIIYERAVCKSLFNDYRKDELRKIFIQNLVE